MNGAYLVSVGLSVPVQHIYPGAPPPGLDIAGLSGESVINHGRELSLLMVRVPVSTLILLAYIPIMVC